MTTALPAAGIGAIQTVGVPVSDQDCALRFYTETLGFELGMDVPLPQLGGRWITVVPPGTSVAVALVAAGDPAARRCRAQRQQLLRPALEPSSVGPLWFCTGQSRPVMGRHAAARERSVTDSYRRRDERTSRRGCPTGSLIGDGPANS